MEKIGREIWSQQKCNFTLDFFFSDWIRKISKTKYYCHNILCTFSCTYYLNSYVSLIRINKPFIQHFVYSVVSLKYAFFNSGKFSWNKFVYTAGPWGTRPWATRASTVRGFELCPKIFEIRGFETFSLRSAGFWWGLTVKKIF